MPESLRHQLLMAIAAGVVLFTNLGGPRLWDRDEPRNAGCAAEMLERGDWVVPVFNGELRAHKPVLLYWLMMSSYATFGVNEFAARFWSAALSIGTVWLTYQIGRRLFDPRAGFWSALALATSLMFGVAGRAATPDATLIFCTTLAMYLYVCDFPRSCVGLQLGHAIVVYAAMGLAVLAKGPVGLVLPTAVIGMYLLIMRLPPRTNSNALDVLRPFAPRHFLATCWSMRPLTALAVVAIIALPWYAWVHYRTEGAFTTGFFLDHNLNRATQTLEGHRGNVLFYPAALVVGFFPWSIFLAPLAVDAFGQLRRRARETPGYVFALCWVGVYVALFSLAKTKLPSYITPCYPGVALLTGAFIARLIRGEAHVAPALMKLTAIASTLVGLALLLGLPLAANQFFPGEEWLAGIGVVPLVAGLLGWLWIARQEMQRYAVTYACASVAFATLLLALAPQRAAEHQRNEELLSAAFERSRAPRIGYFRVLEPSWIFYSGETLDNVRSRNDRDILTPELAPLAGTRRWSRREKIAAADFLASEDHFLITTRSEYETLRAELSHDARIVAEVPYFLRGEERLVLIGRETRVAAHPAGHR